MGSCQSKKETSHSNSSPAKPNIRGKQNGQNKSIDQTISKLSRVNDASQEKQRNLAKTQLPKFEIKEYISSQAGNLTQGHQDFLYACLQGDLNQVLFLIKQLGIIDLAGITGIKTQFVLGSGEHVKIISDASNWNPVLLAVAGKQEVIVKSLCELVPNFHKVNCMSKPYSLTEQQNKIYTHRKRLKKECFALSLSIINQDEKIFKYLWNDHRLLWNMGHFFICLDKILVQDWDYGLKILMASTTSKVIFMSVNTVDDVLDTVYMLEDICTISDYANIRLLKKLKDYLFSRPYYLFCIFLELASFTTSPPREYLNSCLSKLQQDDIQLLHSELLAITTRLDDANLLEAFTERLMAKFEDRDGKIMGQLAALRQAFQEGMQDEKSCIAQLEDLDLFGYRELEIEGVKTNAFVAFMRKGMMAQVEFSLTKGFINARALIRQTNHFELQNNFSIIDISFLLPHVHQLGTFLAILKQVIDFLQLSNILELFDHLVDQQHWDLIGQVLCDPMFQSLFYSSLEYQKYLFMGELKEMSKNEEQILELLVNEPYVAYFMEIKRGNNGEIYTLKTLDFLDKQSLQTKQNKKLSSKRSSLIHMRTKTPHLAQHSNGILPHHGRGLTQITEEGENLQNTQQSKAPLGAAGASQLLKDKEVLGKGRRKGEVVKAEEVKLEFSEEEEEKAVGPTKERVKQKQAQQKKLGINKKDSMKSFKELNISKDLGQPGLKPSQKPQKPTLNPSYLEDHDEPLRSKLKTQAKVVAQVEQEKEEEDDLGSAADASDQESVMSSRVPNVLEKKSRAFPNDPYNEQDPKDTYRRLPSEIIECIKQNNQQKLKFLLAKHKVKNLSWLKSWESDPSITVKGLCVTQPSLHNSPLQSSNHTPATKSPVYDTSQWNPVLYAIYYQRLDILKMLLETYTINMTMAIRQPPPNEFTEYIVPGQKPQHEQWWGKRMQFNQDESLLEMSQVRPSSPDNQGKSEVVAYYSPSEARVECFGLELAIRNRDLSTLQYLWNDQYHKWEERHFAFVLDKALQEHWDLGLTSVFQSKTAKAIFKGLNPEDKDNFLFSKIVDKITSPEYWERERVLRGDDSLKVTEITAKQVELVVGELKNKPFGNYACLKYPGLFFEHGVLDAALVKVTKDDIYDFVVARKENYKHVADYVDEYQLEPQMNKKTLATFKAIMKQAKEYESAQRKPPIDSKDLVTLIKQGDILKLKQHFDKPGTKVQLKLMNQLQGFIDADYDKLFKQTVKYTPSDETIQILLGDGSTAEWNPLIFAIFYQKKEVVEYLCESKKVYIRNCLTTPFIIEVDEDAEDLDEEKFIKEKTEIFCLVLCIMLNNREIFKYLWRKCAYIWNEIHLVTLANFIFEAQWLDGIRILFASANTHQIFNAMNMYEKEKFLKFCDKSVGKQGDSVVRDFRYQMSFDPYNIYYLPIMATREDLQSWDKEEVSKEIFIKNCQINFDERSFALLSQLNTHFLSEFISTAEECTESEVVQNFAQKLKRYMRGRQQ